MAGKPLVRSDFAGLELIKRGKVRDLYTVEGKLLLVASDRISAFDVVMDDPIPDKGKILTSISLFWFKTLESIAENHVIASDPDNYPEACRPYREELRGRSMLVDKAEPLPVECIVRGYLSGSGWSEYQKQGSVCDIPLPPGLLESQKLPQPLFTPSTKAEAGFHDENISFDKAVDILGKKRAEAVRDISLRIYVAGSELAAKKGIIIADTKFEFGLRGGRLILIDEVLTPDSSRFWPADAYRPGGSQQSFDKQYLRDYLSSLAWPKEPPPPRLPKEVIDKTKERYMEALLRLTGHGLD
jgi:phosphoribosylaminoimidazole-succinocarboxamide synthase